MLYPLQFKPQLKERIWGGTKLNTHLNKAIASQTVGESWEISTVEDNISIISNGFLKGKSLQEAIEAFPNEILGNKVSQKFGTNFPLLFKFIDAKQDLSIQVHPNDELAKARHNSFGKTEMWYVLQADSDARLIVGFKNKSSIEEYLQHLQNKTLLTLLDTKKVSSGDVYFLETGTIHAIGAGILIAEIQQTSDITYRVYDFDRLDNERKPRELHLELAQDAINFDTVTAEKQYSKTVNTSNSVVECPYFTTNFIPLQGKIEMNNNYDSFIVYMCVKGSFQIKHNKNIYNFAMGDTLLMPASLKNYELTGNAELLETFIR